MQVMQKKHFYHKEVNLNEISEIKKQYTSIVTSNFSLPRVS